MEAFIPSAGLGTRLKPLTDSIPKALVEINGTPLLEIIIRRLSNAGVNHFVINTHHFSEKIHEFLELKKYFNASIDISDEKNLLLDTGGGFKKASAFLKEENFLIHNVDILSGISIKSFMDFHIQNGFTATLAVQERESSRYFLFDEEKLLCGWENIKTGEKKITRTPAGGLRRFAFSGIHTVNRKIFRFFPPQEVFSIIDFYLSIAGDYPIAYFDHSETDFIDLGKIENLKEAEKKFINF